MWLVICFYFVEALLGIIKINMHLLAKLSQLSKIICVILFLTYTISCNNEEVKPEVGMASFHVYAENDEGSVSPAFLATQTSNNQESRYDTTALYKDPLSSSYFFSDTLKFMTGSHELYSVQVLDKENNVLSYAPLEDSKNASEVIDLLPYSIFIEEQKHTILEIKTVAHDENDTDEKRAISFSVTNIPEETSLVHLSIESLTPDQMGTASFMQHIPGESTATGEFALSNGEFNLHILLFDGQEEVNGGAAAWVDTPCTSEQESNYFAGKEVAYSLTLDNENTEIVIDNIQWNEMENNRKIVQIKQENTIDDQTEHEKILVIAPTNICDIGYRVIYNENPNPVFTTYSHDIEVRLQQRNDFNLYKCFDCEVKHDGLINDLTIYCEDDEPWIDANTLIWLSLESSELSCQMTALVAFGWEQ